MDRSKLPALLVAVAILAPSVRLRGNRCLADEVPGKPPAGRVPIGAAQGRVAPRRVFVQPGWPRRFDGPDAKMTQEVFWPPDRKVTRRLSEARQLLRNQRYVTAAKLLDVLLKEPAEDFLLRPDANHSAFHSLRSEVHQIIGQMPTKGREAYELQFGPKARELLDSAIRSGDVTQLSKVPRRYFHTQAGYEAIMLQGRHELDHGRPLAAAICLKKLCETPAATAQLEPELSILLATSWIQAGMLDRAQQVLSSLKKRHSEVVIEVAGEQKKLFAPGAKPLAWLRATVPVKTIALDQSPSEWLLFRGNASRNAQSAGGIGLLMEPRWRSHVGQYASGSTGKLISQLQHAYRLNGFTALPSMHPLAMDSVILIRSMNRVFAIDIQSGKIIWKINSNRYNSNSPVSISALDHRMWDESIYGTLSSDGENVYVIEKVIPQPSFLEIMPNGRERPKKINRLAAYQLKKEGKPLWTDDDSGSQASPELAGAFFLGPPLPLSGELYALVETQGQNKEREIRLVVLDANTGHFKWSQQLVLAPQYDFVRSMRAGRFLNVSPPLRHFAGASPSEANGIIVCPTSAGGVVAVDRSSQSLLWGFQYERRGNDLWKSRFESLQDRSPPKAADRWNDSSITIVNNRVLVTPVESDYLFCLNLDDGKLLWKYARLDNLYLACVHKGKPQDDLVILVGRHHVSALKLSDGKPAWNDKRLTDETLEHITVATGKTLPLPPDSMPSGRGFYSQGHYYLPLTTAEVAKIDLDRGVIVHRARSRTGSIPGNLICYEDQIISQSVENLEAFYQIEPLKRWAAKTLKEDPNHSKALVRTGQIHFEQGRLLEAMDFFNRAYTRNPSPMTRKMLLASLLESMRTDFASSRRWALKLQDLITEPNDQADYLRLLATGLHKSGEIMSAFDAYLKLVDLVKKPELLNIDKVSPQSHWQVRPDRWVQPRLSELRAAASEQQQATMDAKVSARIKVALDSRSVPRLRSLTNFFAAFPAVEQAQEQLVALLSGEETVLKREFILRRLERSSDTKRSRAAVARLAQLLAGANRPDHAAIYYHRLATQYKDTVCLDGKTGAELARMAPVAVGQRLAKAQPWPTGQVIPKISKATVDSSRKPPLVERRFGRPFSPRPNGFNLKLVGPHNPFFDDSTVWIDPNRRNLIGRDGMGQEQWRVSLAEPERTALQANRNSGSTHGHLLVVSTGIHLLAIDTLRSKESISDRNLWKQDQIEKLPGNLNDLSKPQSELQRMRIGLRFARRQREPAEQSNTPSVGKTIHVTGTGVYYQRGRQLICVDPLSGETLWIRGNFPRGSKIFGDDQLIFVVPPSAGSSSFTHRLSGDAYVFRAVDGKKLGTRVLPLNNPLLTVGRHLVYWFRDGDNMTLDIHNLWTGKSTSQQFPAGTKASIISQELIGFLSPGGKFVLLSLPDGRPMIEEQVVPEPSLEGIVVLQSREHYFLITRHRVTESDPTRRYLPALGQQRNPIIDGRVYRFDRRTGKKTWPVPAEIHQHGLVLDQPRNLPVLVFLRYLHKSSSSPGRTRTELTRLSVLCLDKRNGQIVYANDDLPANLSGFEIKADRQKETVWLMLSGKTIELKFTDKPTPPAPPSKKKVKPFKKE